MPLQTLKPKIPAGQSLSDAVDCSTGTVLVMTVPYNWTSANLTVQVSSDGVEFYDVVDRAGREFIFPAVAGTAISLGGDDVAWKGMHLKLRSGSRAYPVKQLEDAEFTVAIQS